MSLKVKRLILTVVLAFLIFGVSIIFLILSGGLDENNFPNNQIAYIIGYPAISWAILIHNLFGIEAKITILVALLLLLTQASTIGYLISILVIKKS